MRYFQVSEDQRDSMKQAERFLRITIAISLLALALPIAALNTPATTDAFVGTWQGQFQSKTFLTVTLTMLNNQLTGTVSHASVQVDKDGELTSAETKDGSDPVMDPRLSGQTLSFSTQGESQTSQYEMTLTGANEAELKLKPPAGQVAAKPWALQKVTAAVNSTTQRDVKSKLANAAQIWLNGQFGTGASSGGATNASPALGSSTTAATGSASAVPALKISAEVLDPDLRKDIDGLPRRVNDQFKNLGDMVNFVLVGSKEQVQNALQAATWNIADTDNRESGLKAVLDTYQGKDYLTMPMSKLYLFDRIQDFGYEEAEPYAVVASRHHFRIWQAPFTWNGQTVWVGAGTHDIGFEKDQRNGKVTHKIDPAVDGERDNIGATLQKAGKVKSMSYYLPPDPIQETHNATGGSYHSDGRLLVIILQ
jgi:hypothetical protein